MSELLQSKPIGHRMQASGWQKGTNVRVSKRPRRQIGNLSAEGAGEIWCESGQPVRLLLSMEKKHRGIHHAMWQGGCQRMMKLSLDLRVGRKPGVVRARKERSLTGTHSVLDPKVATPARLPTAHTEKITGSNICRRSSGQSSDGQRSAETQHCPQNIRIRRS